MDRLGEHLLSAIEHLEQEGIAHRDVKPDNIGIAKAPRAFCMVTIGAVCTTSASRVAAQSVS
jgi:serine/threonine protein kinase